MYRTGAAPAVAEGLFTEPPTCCQWPIESPRWWHHLLVRLVREKLLGPLQLRQPTHFPGSFQRYPPLPSALLQPVPHSLDIHVHPGPPFPRTATHDSTPPGRSKFASAVMAGSSIFISRGSSFASIPAGRTKARFRLGPQ